MRYLKLFEDHSKGYDEITREEYNLLTIGDGDSNYYDEDDGLSWYDDVKFIQDNWTAFTPKEIEMVKQLLPDVQAKTILSTDVQGARLDSKQSGVIMIKLRDEWYYVMMNMSDQEEGNQFFKCDQFEGLLQLIKDYI